VLCCAAAAAVLALAVGCNMLADTKTDAKRDEAVKALNNTVQELDKKVTALKEKADKATGDEKAVADAVVENMAYGLIPEGPVRRAVVFGGSNLHIFGDQYTGHPVDRKAANAFVAFTCGPEWSVKNSGNWTGSNPGNLNGFKTDDMKKRLDTIKFLDVTSSMLPYGIPFPVIPESTEIMNNIVPTMVQNALTGKMSVKDAADDAANNIKALIAQRKQ
jgi:multiple sugar transport system substrate-binding protein